MSFYNFGLLLCLLVSASLAIIPNQDGEADEMSINMDFDKFKDVDIFKDDTVSDHVDEAEEDHHSTIACLAKLITIKQSPCKITNNAKFEASGIKPKIVGVMLGITTLTESEKDLICCYHKADEACVEQEAGKECANDLPRIRETSNQIQKRFLNLDCTARNSKCQETVTKRTTVGTDVVEAKVTSGDQSALITVMKNIGNKSDQGIMRLSDELKTLSKQLNSQYAQINEKLNDLMENMSIRSNRIDP